MGHGGRDIREQLVRVEIKEHRRLSAARRESGVEI